MSAFTKIVIKIYNKVSNNTISEYGDALHTQTIALSVIWGAMMYSLIKKAGSDPVSSEKTIVPRSVVSVAVALLQVMHREMPKTLQNGDVAFLLLVQCANSEKWEVTVLNSKYKYFKKSNN